MRGKKQRRKILTGRSDSDFWLFLLSCCVSVCCSLFPFSLMPAFENAFFFAIEAGSFFLLWRISSWLSWMKAAECWVGWRGERNIGERGCISRHACVGSSQSPLVPWDATTQPSQAQHRAIQAESRESRTRHPHVWYKLHANCLGFSFPSRILLAAIILLRLVCNDWPALHIWYEANG